VQPTATSLALPPTRVPEAGDLPFTTATARGTDPIVSRPAAVPDSVKASDGSGDAIASAILSVLGGSSEQHTTVERQSIPGGNTQSPDRAVDPTSVLIGNTAIAVDPTDPTAVVIAGSITLSPGQSTAISGTPVALWSGSIVVGPETLTVPGPAPSTFMAESVALITLASQTITAIAEPSGAISVAETTLRAGQIFIPHVGSSDVVISAWSSGIVADGVTASFSDPTMPIATLAALSAVFTLGFQTLTAQAQDGGSSIAGTRLSVGQRLVVSGHILLADTHGITVDGTSTAVFSAAQTPGIGAVFSLGSAQMTATATFGKALIAGKTLTPGDVVTINGYTVSDAATAVVVDGSTLALSQLAAVPTCNAVVQAPGLSATTIAEDGTVLLDGSVVTPGQVVTISGHTVSDASTALVVDSSTIPFSTLQATPTTAILAATITAAGLTAIALVASGDSGTVLLDGYTLTPGQIAIISGHMVFDAATALVVDGTTVPLSSTGPAQPPVAATRAAPSRAEDSSAIRCREVGWASLLTAIVWATVVGIVILI